MEPEEAKSSEPYLSIVVASRNDDHGGSLTERSNAFLAGLAAQVAAFGIDAEVILVEWNPPADRPSLAEQLDWSVFAELPIRPRIVRVPPDVHRAIDHSEKLPLFQMIAKNVGVRRARGRFVLATNIDVLFSDSLMAWLAGRPLKEDCYYRVDRYDVPMVAPLTVPPGKRDQWYESMAFRVARRDGIYVRAANKPDSAFQRDALRSPTRALARFFNEVSGGKDGSIGDRLRGVVAVVRKILQVVGRYWRTPPHTNASGDFMLMHHDQWDGLRGYAEFPAHSWHLDGLLVHQALHRGLEEAALAPPQCIYHIEHGGGWSPEGHKGLFESLAQRRIPFISERDLWALTERIRRSPRDMCFNDEDWGLAGEALEDATPQYTGGI